MELHLPKDLETKVERSAAERHRKPDELIQDVLTLYFQEAERLVEAVKIGEDALQRGEYLTHELVVRRLDRFLHP